MIAPVSLPWAEPRWLTLLIDRLDAEAEPRPDRAQMARRISARLVPADLGKLHCHTAGGPQETAGGSLNAPAGPRLQKHTAR